MIIEIGDKTLKLRKGRYVVYDVNYLLSHLPQEIALLYSVSHLSNNISLNLENMEFEIKTYINEVYKQKGVVWDRKAEELLEVLNAIHKIRLEGDEEDDLS